MAPLAKPFPEAVTVKGPIPARAGEIEESCGVELRIVAVTVVLSDELTDASIATELGLGIFNGAVYSALASPVGVIVPTARLPFRAPFTNQLIEVVLTPVPVTVSCCVVLARTVSGVGEIMMLWPSDPADGLASFEIVTPEQLTVKLTQAMAKNGAHRFRNFSPVFRPRLGSLPSTAGSRCCT